MANCKEGKAATNPGSQPKKRYIPIDKELAKKSLKEIRMEKLQKINSKRMCKPKRPISAFFFFTIQNRKKIYSEDPNIGFKDIAIRSAKDWAKLSEEERKPFEELRTKDKLRYDKECK